MIGWIYMIIIDLLIPLSMLFIGIYFRKRAPQNIDGAFGYRTNRSRMNRQTWEFAHHYCGTVWSIAGAVMSVLTVIWSLFFISSDFMSAMAACNVTALLQCLIMILTIFPTERALKANFDEFGNKIER